MRSGALLALVLGTILCVAVSAIPAAGFSVSPLVRDAIDYLKTRGLLPLWTGITRPVLPWDLKAALDAADLAARRPSLSTQDLAVFAVLEAESGQHYVTEALASAPFGQPRTNGGLTASTVSSSWTAGWALDSYTAALATQEGGLSWLAGRTPLGWGPAPSGSELLFDGFAGGLDALQWSFVWRKARFTKVVGWLDAGRSIVGTRLDVPYRSNLRLGFGESVLMQGVPYMPYILAPLPIGMNPSLWKYLRQPQGFDDNFFLTFDAEWVPRPGLRIFGELLVDDFTVPAPTANFPSRWGLTIGFHTVSDRGDGFQGMYTIVPNWTYSATNPAVHYLLRDLPMGHVLGADFDVVHLRRMFSAPPATSLWAAYIRKGEGRVGQIWIDEAEARQHAFLRGVVEYSIIAGVDMPYTTPEWSGTVGPWLAYRSNADHVAGASRVDWGINLTLAASF